MLPYLIGLTHNFTQCKLGMILSFRSVYTNRLYMLLKQKRDHNPHAKYYDFDLLELRKLLGVSVERIERTDKFDKAQEAIELYPDYTNFKLRVLEVARKELGNKEGTEGKGDIGFDYEEVRHGKRVVTIRFNVFPIYRKGINSAPINGQLYLSLDVKNDKDLDPITILLTFVPDQHRAKKGVRATIEAAEKQHGFDYVKRNILYSNAHAAKNYAGYLAGALAIDYGHDWELEQQQAAKAAEQAQKTITVQELNNLAEEIRALQRNSKLTNSPEMWQQAEVLKAEYARKREIYDAENSNEEEETAE